MSRSRRKPQGKQVYKFTLDADDPTEAQIVDALDKLAKGYKLSLFMRMLLANSMGLDPFPFSPFSLVSPSMPFREETASSQPMQKAVRPDERWRSIRAKRPTPIEHEPDREVERVSTNDELAAATATMLSQFG